MLGWPTTPNVPLGLQASPYPVILSLENHCALEQQRVMARHLQAILGPMLLNRQLDGVTNSLPSPEVCGGDMGSQGEGGEPGREARCVLTSCPSTPSN